MIESMATDYVTHDEFDSAMTAIKQDFDRLDGKIDRLEDKVDRGFESVDRRFEQVDRRFEQILTILASIDANMKELRALPARMEYVELAVEKLQNK